MHFRRSLILFDFLTRRHMLRSLASVSQEPSVTLATPLHRSHRRGFQNLLLLSHRIRPRSYPPIALCFPESQVSPPSVRPVSLGCRFLVRALRTDLHGSLATSTSVMLPQRSCGPPRCLSSPHHPYSPGDGALRIPRLALEQFSTSPGPSSRICWSRLHCTRLAHYFLSMLPSSRLGVLRRMIGR